jgi:hypothetical protein
MGTIEIPLLDVLCNPNIGNVSITDAAIAIPYKRKTHSFD